MRTGIAQKIATGGVLAAVAMVIMAIGCTIPVGTFVCPAVCILISAVVLRICSVRIGWAWYGTVALLSILLCPDKEAATVYVCLGYYPIVRPVFNKLRLSWLVKIIYFNGSVFVLYAVLIKILGFSEIAGAYQMFAWAGLLILLLLGNITFWLLDILLLRISGKSVRC